MKKKNFGMALLSVLMVVIMILSSVCTASAEAEPTYEYGDIMVYFSRSSDEKTTGHRFYYSDEFFNYDNSVFHNDLALFSLAMAASAFTAQETINLNGENLDSDNFIRATNIKKAYDAINFSDCRFYSYDKALTDTSDKVAFSLARKYVYDESGKLNTVVAVMLRGAYYGAEWSSNFNLFDQYGDIQNHAGFQKSADEVYEKTERYISELNRNGELKGELKVWISGFSRSAGVADLTSHMFNYPKKGDAFDTLFDSSNLYSYNSAAPNGAYIPDGGQFEKDKNIWCVCSPSDFVNRMAPKAWGYKHYGNDVYLPDEITPFVENTFRQFIKDSSHEGSSPCSKYQTEYMDYIAALITDEGIKDSYRNTLQKIIVASVGTIFASGNYSDLFASEDAQESTGFLTQLVFNDAQINMEEFATNFTAAHCPEHYMAWLYNYDMANYNGPDEDDIFTGFSDDSPFMDYTGTADTENDTSLKSRRIHLKLGDADINTEVNMVDVTLLQKNIAKLVYLSQEASFAADVNGDREITMLDVTLMQRYIAKLIDTFPAADKKTMR